MLYYGMMREAGLYGAITRSTALRLELLAEPGIHVLKCMENVQCPGLEDNKHQPIGIAADQKLGTRQLHPLDLILTMPELPGRRIPLLKGTIDAQVARMVPMELANVTEKHTLALEGMNIEVSPLESENDTILHVLRVEYTRGTMAPEKWAGSS